MDTPTRAAWIGVTDAELPAIRRAFDAQLADALRAAFPAATLDTDGAAWQISADGRTARLWEPNAFWGDEPEDFRVARAVAAVAEQLAPAPLPVVVSYTRAQALADGALIDVSATAREAGFTWPVALTAALWADVQSIPPALQGVADVAGRLWDVLWMGRCAVRRAPEAHDLRYELILPTGDETWATTELYTVRAIAGPGDDGEPVITLMRPDEG